VIEASFWCVEIFLAMISIDFALPLREKPLLMPLSRQLKHLGQTSADDCFSAEARKILLDSGRWQHALAVYTVDRTCRPKTRIASKNGPLCFPLDSAQLSG
jgi:hypothetical protein